MSNVPKLRFKGFCDDWSYIELGSKLNYLSSGVTPKGGREVYQDKGIIF